MFTCILQVFFFILLYIFLYFYILYNNVNSAGIGTVGRIRIHEISERIRKLCGSGFAKCSCCNEMLFEMLIQGHCRKCPWKSVFRRILRIRNKLPSRIWIRNSELRSLTILPKFWRCQEIFCFPVVLFSLRFKEGTFDLFMEDPNPEPDPDP
jgi:hypothetical protein